MSIAVKISNELAHEAKVESKVLKRSMAGQIEFWASIGRVAEANSDLPYAFIRDTLIAKEQVEQGDFTEYKFG
jgi:hypothetical protein